LFLLTICLGLAMGAGVLSQAEIIEEVILDETVKAEDLELKEPWLLPDNPFYFLKDWGRAIQSVFTFNKVKKAELESKYANERLLEIRKMVEENKDPEEIKEATEKYKKTLDKTGERAEKINEKAAENPGVEKLLDKYTNHQILHERILQRLKTQVPEEVFEKIEDARERHLERFGEIMTKLEDREEKIKENLEEAFEEQEGSKYKNFKNLEVLIELEEKVPEQAREAIRGAQENALKRLQGDLEKMSPEDQERFKDYIEEISGDKEKQLEILEKIRLQTREETELRETLREARENVLEQVPVELEKIERIECPVIEKPSPGFCEEGRMVIEKDEKGCPKSFRCMMESQQEIKLELLKPAE
jgi:hypothetical protein